MMSAQNDPLAEAKLFYRVTSGEKIAKMLDYCGTRKFTRDIILAASKQDAVDAAYELEYLAQLFKDRADRLLEEGLLGWNSRLEELDDN